MEQTRLRRTRRRPLARLALLSLVIFCLGWTGLWFFARREAANLIDGWIASEVDHDRVWTCADRRITGFPLELRLSCSALAVRGRFGARSLHATVGGLSASVWLYQTNAVDAVLTSPLVIDGMDGAAPSRLSWSQFSIHGRGLGETRTRAALLIDDAVLDDRGAHDTIAHGELRFAPAAGRPREEHAYEESLTLDRASLPALDAATEETAPLSVDQKGVVTALDPTLPDVWPGIAEAWRQAGGRVDLASLHLLKGGFRADAHGTLGLDEGHRVAGRLETTVAGYESLARRFGLSAEALTMGTLLAHVLGGASLPQPDKSDPSRAPGITLPLSFAEGRVKVGPVTTSQRLQPLY